MKLKTLKHALLAFLALTVLCQAEVVTNWEGGFEVNIPDTWLRRDMGPDGLKLASEEVRMDVQMYGGVSLNDQIRHLHAVTKEDGYKFKEEFSFALNGVPAHEMIFRKDGHYKLYYVVQSGDRGFLWTVTSESTDSPAFMEGQSIINSFRVIPR